MFKVEITDWVSYGDGSYGAETSVGMARSPKEAWKRATKFNHPQNQWSTTANHTYGGCPVLQRRRMWRGSKLIMEVID